MSFDIDLKELSSRESERVEWKENGDDKFIVNSIVKTINIIKVITGCNTILS